MKKATIFFFSLVLILASCKTDKKAEKASSEEAALEEHSASAEESTVTEGQFSPPELSEVNFDDLLEVQLNIIDQPEDPGLKKEFLKKAFFESKRALVTIGAGRLTHPETGAPLSRAMVKRAAQIDANRWAAYGLSWIKNDLNPDFGHLDTTFQGMQSVLLSFDRGDSLFIAIASEID